MGREERLRKHDAVYWARSGVADNGQVTLAAYSDLKVQWVEKHKNLADAQGGVISADVQLVVGQALTIGSIVAKGKYEDYVSTDMKYKVVGYDEQTTLRNRKKRRVAYLVRFGATLPDLAS